MGGGYVGGYEGEGMKEKNEMMGCVKEFGVYGGWEWGGEYNWVDMSGKVMYNV